MAAAIVVVLIIAAGGQPQATTAALTRSLEEALEPGAMVLVKQTAASSDEEIASAASSVHADAVAVVVWSDSESRHATLRVHRPSTGSVVAREMDFRPSDAALDRGRAVGFAIASMMPSVPLGAGPARQPAKLPSAPAPIPVAPTARAPTTPPEPPSDATNPSADAERRWGIDLLLAAAGGIGGDAGGLGGAIGARYFPVDRLDVRGAVAITNGSIPGVQGSLTLVRPTIGVGWQAIRTKRASLSPRFELGPWYHTVVRSGDSRSEGGRWVLGVALALEGTWRVLERLEIIAIAGVDVAFGRTRVFVGAEERTSIPVLRLVGLTGARIAF